MTDMRTRSRHNLKTNVPGVRPTGGTATLRQLVVPFLIKAEAIDEDARTFEGLAAVWDLDLGDDVIHKGAFKTTIASWKKSGDALPLLNSHDQWDIFSAIGQLLEAKETADGLWTKWEVIPGTDGDAVLARLRPSIRTKRSVIGKMSIGYQPVKFEYERSPEARFGQIRHLKEVELHEVSLVIFPMAPGARVDVSTVKTLLASAQEIDPQTITDDMKPDLRRLASRIGLLLKDRKADDTPHPNTDPTPISDPAPASPTPPGEDAPTDPDETDDAGGDGDSDPAPASSAPSAEDTDETGDGQGPDNDSVKVYEYPDALTQRLQRTLLKHKTSTVVNHSNRTQS